MVAANDEKDQRILFLDNLKSFVVCLMILFHIATCYMEYAPEYWYVVDKADPKFSFMMFVQWADVFIIPIIFFLAGYFGIQSLSRHPAGSFWKSKLYRVILPWILGVAIFAAPVSYLMLASRGVDIPFGEFFFRFFLFGPCFSHIQYWILGMLVFMYALLFVAYRLRPQLLKKSEAAAPGIKVFLLLAALSYSLTAGSYLLLHSNTDVWYTIWPIFLFQPTRISLYMIYFVLGAYGWRKQWFAIGVYQADPAKWLPAGIVLSIVYLWYSLFGSGIAASQTQYIMIKSAFQVLFLMSAVFGLIAVFQAKLDFTNGFFKALAVNSYTMYYVHLQIVLPIAWFFMGIELPVYLKFALVSISGILLVYFIGRILLFLPVFRPRK